LPIFQWLVQEILLHANNGSRLQTSYLPKSKRKIAILLGPIKSRPGEEEDLKKNIPPNQSDDSEENNHFHYQNQVIY
jgi:hypothetical protein